MEKRLHSDFLPEGYRSFGCDDEYRGSLNIRLGKLMEKYWGR